LCCTDNTTSTYPQTHPTRHTHCYKHQRDQGAIGFAHTGTPWSLHIPCREAGQHTSACRSKGRSSVCRQRSLPTRRQGDTSVGLRARAPSSQRLGSPTAQPHQGAWHCRAAQDTCRVGRGPEESPDTFQPDRAQATPVQAMSLSGVRAATRPPGAGVPPVVPPSLLPSKKHDQHQMAKRRSQRGERCAAACGTARPPRPPPRRSERAAAGALGAWAGRPAPPSLRPRRSPAWACALRPPSR
jgi:hypothetical protein